ncbi:MAG: hypothetical protein BroJett038_16970 [Chloroflexota bacterium]|nr:MAG: hypothetical protein BroJett038_16970 [Chloroflexota bacterium]
MGSRAAVLQSGQPGKRRMERVMLTVRQAALDDTQAISRLFRSRITAWQRLDDRGQVQDVPYEALTIYERWLHGGPWMSIETAALQLSHLLRGAGLPAVVEAGGQVRGYSEAYYGQEPAPFGGHLHLAHLAAEADDAGLQDALITGCLERAAALKCARVTVSCLASDQPSRSVYERHGFEALARVRRFNLPAKTGQVFYRATEHLDANPEQIRDWYMPVGRTGSARQQWETLWPRTWFAIPELRNQRAHRLHFSVAGQEAFVYCQQQLYLPRCADVFIWSPRPLSPQTLAAVRDWAHREGYRTLTMIVPDEAAAVLGAEAEPDGFALDIYATPV